jgi:hypothetical protein
MSAILSFTVANIERKVDINVYFYPSAPETQIVDLQSVIGTVTAGSICRICIRAMLR